MKQDLKDRILAVHTQGPNWKILTQKTRKGLIHTLMMSTEKALLLREVDLIDGKEIPIFPGEFLSYINSYGNLVPIMRV